MKKIRKPRFLLVAGSLFVLALSVVVVSSPRPAHAFSVIPCEMCLTGVVEAELEEWVTDYVGGTYWRLSRHMRSEMVAQKVWMVSIFWEDNVLPALMLMANQLTAVATQQMQIVGAFMDAKQQLETQQALQRIAARTHKEYQTTVGLCEFASAAKSLAHSDRKSEANALMLAQRAQDRQLGAVNTAASLGAHGDLANRIKQYREKFCDPRDNNNGLNFMCDWDQDNVPGPQIGGGDPVRLNKDIDYKRTIDSPLALDIFDMVTLPWRGDLADQEEEVFAMASNLYGSEIFIRPPNVELRPLTTERITNIQKVYLDMRAVVAKLAVAENSFNAIVGMKTEGSTGSYGYLRDLMVELGADPGEAMDWLGYNAPSYWAQMEVLTKKIYQNPDFYTNLYDTPTNVERKKVAMQAIGLMQKFDLFKSHLRAESSLSVILELAVVDLQNEIENEINQAVGEGD
ncbi:MAG TPA: hypothetical protein PKX38_02610 [Alphaproteobacteria bacterium]|nr:hypothetical protein [Micavibrio sp.]MBK9562315.1 hypothetical protein [Micavibrio sp.]HQX26809.1 hypothetical protein [Alphaproteobacteria bacterium]